MASQWPPKKGAAFTLYFTLYKNDGTIVANPGTYTTKVSIDGGAVATFANTITEEDTTYGQLSIVLSTSEMNGDAIWVYVTDNTAGTVPFTCTLYTAANLMDDIKTDTAAVKVKTDYLPSATAGGAGGVFIAGTNAATTITTGLTTTFTGNLTGSVGSVTGAVGSVTGAVGSVTAGVTLAASAVQAIWDALTSALTTVGSIGKLLVDNINATISSRLATAGYTAPDNTSIASILVDTAEIGVAGAGLTVLATQTSVNDLPTKAELATALGTADDAVLAQVALVKAVTDKVDTTLVLDGAVYDFTAAALAAAPTGGGSAPTAGEVADAVWDEALADHVAAGSTGQRLGRNAGITNV